MWHVSGARMAIEDARRRIEAEVEPPAARYSAKVLTRSARTLGALDRKP